MKLNIGFFFKLIYIHKSEGKGVRKYICTNYSYNDSLIIFSVQFYTSSNTSRLLGTLQVQTAWLSSMLVSMLCNWPTFFWDARLLTYQVKEKHLSLIKTAARILCSSWLNSYSFGSRKTFYTVFIQFNRKTECCIKTAQNMGF